MKTRFYSLTVAAFVLIGACSNSLFAQLKLQVDRQTGDMTLTGVDATTVNFSAYGIASQYDAITNGNWTGVRSTDPVDGQGMTINGIHTQADWVAAGIPGPGSVAELNQNGDPVAGSTSDDSTFYGIGSSAYDSALAKAGAPLGEDIEQTDLTLTYYDQIADETLTGVVEFVGGEKIFNNIGITIDLADGNAYIENESPQASLTITGYLIESISGGNLNTGAGFTGLGGNFQSPTTPNGDDLGELINTPGAGFALASSPDLDTLGTSIGQVLADGVSLEAINDITFNFILEGVGEVQRDGFVKFINAGLTGDYNGDDVVDLADYTIWRNNLGEDESVLGGPGDGSGVVDEGDYTVWRANYGATLPLSGLSTSTNVPEPGTAIVTVVLAAIGAMHIRRKH